MKKYKTIEVIDSESGEKRKFIFKPVYKLEDPNNLLCEDLCPYNIDLCTKLPYPDPVLAKEGKTFRDLCDEADDILNRQRNIPSGDSDVREECAAFIPLVGTIEENYRNVEYFQDLIKKNSLVCIRKVINAICGEECEYFNEDLSECKSTNKSCILHELFKNIDGKNK